MSIIVMNSYEFTERRKHFEHVYVGYYDNNTDSILFPVFSIEFR